MLAHKPAKYGVWVEKNNYGKYMGVARTAFVIDEKEAWLKFESVKQRTLKKCDLRYE